MKILIVLVCAFVLALARPQGEGGEGGGDSETTPETTPETSPENTPENTPETTPENTPENTPETPAENTPENTPETTPETSPENTPVSPPENESKEKEKDPQQAKVTDKNIYTDKDGNPLMVWPIVCPTTEPFLGASLTIPENEEPPLHAITDSYGAPMKQNDVIEHVVGDNTVRIFTERWLTKYTQPATKPNCLCQTRGPLSKFKLMGNLHFKNIKVPHKRRAYSLTTDESNTECPPCNCADCFTTQTVTRKRDKVC